MIEFKVGDRVVFVGPTETFTGTITDIGVNEVLRYEVLYDNGYSCYERGKDLEPVTSAAERSSDLMAGVQAPAVEE